MIAIFYKQFAPNGADKIILILYLQNKFCAQKNL